MGKIMKSLLLVGCLGMLSACGFHFKTGELLPKELRTMQYKSADTYGSMSRTMRQTLRLNAIKLVEDQKDVPIFYLDGSSESSEVSALFASGKEAEKVMILKVDASVKMPDGRVYPLTTRVVRNFFDNPKEALAKATEKDAIWSKMREQAANQLINRLFALKDQINAKETTK